MSNILLNQPKIRNRTTKEREPESSYHFLVQKRENTLSAKKSKGWKYLVTGHGKEKQGFSRSRRGALIRIKLWMIRQEAGRKKHGKTSPVGKEEIFLLAGEKNRSFLASLQDSLEAEKLGEDLLLFSGKKASFYNSNKNRWIAGVIRKDQLQEFAGEASSRRAAERTALRAIEREESMKEFSRMRELLEKGKKV